MPETSKLHGHGSPQTKKPSQSEHQSSIKVSAQLARPNTQVIALPAAERHLTKRPTDDNRTSGELTEVGTGGIESARVVSQIQQYSFSYPSLHAGGVEIAIHLEDELVVVVAQHAVQIDHVVTPAGWVAAVVMAGAPHAVVLAD
jgi:hypothetical protein